MSNPLLTKLQVALMWFTIAVAIILFFPFVIYGISTIVVIAAKASFWIVLYKLATCLLFGLGSGMGFSNWLHLYKRNKG